MTLHKTLVLLTPVPYIPPNFQLTLPLELKTEVALQLDLQFPGRTLNLGKQTFVSLIQGNETQDLSLSLPISYHHSLVGETLRPGIFMMRELFILYPLVLVTP